MQFRQRQVVFFKAIMNDRGIVTKGGAPFAQVRFLSEPDFNSVGLQRKGKFDFSDRRGCHAGTLHGGVGSMLTPGQPLSKQMGDRKLYD